MFLLRLVLCGDQQRLNCVRSNARQDHVALIAAIQVEKGAGRNILYRLRRNGFCNVSLAGNARSCCESSRVVRFWA
jgi:hypothetical protein